MEDMIDMRGKAENLAYRAHQGQFRRDGKTPYIKHCELVVKRLAEADDVGKVVAWMHDVMEDCDNSYADEIWTKFPKEIAEVCEILVNPPESDKSYFDHLTEVRKNVLAKRVKVADMLANLSDSPTDRQIIKYAKGLLILLSN